MAVVTTNLGVITAYGDAVAAGYTGTKAQWQALMADYATVGQQAAQSAQTASTAATTATTAAQTATTKASEASASATAAEQAAASISTPDTTLTQSGKAADAKATGDKISEIKEDLLDLEQEGYPMASIQEAVNAWADEHKTEIVNNYVTPEMYGAKGDGTTDDTSAIQSAVSSGKNVKFGKKTYICGMITVNVSDVVIDGNGATLNHGGNSGFVVAHTAHDITFRNIKSVCTYVKDSQATTNVHIGINANAESPNGEFYAHDITIENCTFSGGVMGVSASSAKNIDIENCEFNDFVFKPEDRAADMESYSNHALTRKSASATLISEHMDGTTFMYPQIRGRQQTNSART